MRTVTVYAMCFLTLLHIALIIFLDASPPGLDEALWLESLLNMETWSTASTTLFWVSLLASSVGALIAAMMWMKTEFPIYAAIAVTGLVSSIGPYTTLYSHLNGYATSAAGMDGFTATIPIMVPFALPIVIAWAFIIMEFARGRD